MQAQTPARSFRPRASAAAPETWPRAAPTTTTPTRGPEAPASAAEMPAPTLPTTAGSAAASTAAASARQQGRSLWHPSRSWRMRRRSTQPSRSNGERRLRRRRDWRPNGPHWRPKRRPLKSSSRDSRPFTSRPWLPCSRIRRKNPALSSPECPPRTLRALPPSRRFLMSPSCLPPSRIRLQTSSQDRCSQVRSCSVASPSAATNSRPCSRPKRRPFVAS
mmetsp:Transcript_77444/g.160945  ORF Transcript_77444/g.160945 Transcript_77444/m.160945 type:complete len:219 (-) Transcript_77444:493-1149(-)